MSEAFRIWFKFEICLFSVPVVLVPAIMTQVEGDGAPVEVKLFAASLFIACVLVFYSVFKLMSYVFGDKPATHSKLILAFIVYWAVNWLAAFFYSNQIDSLIIQVLTFGPILVLGHLLFIGRSYFRNAT
ncbi:hypothetical protein [Aliiglaciecola litoralis]|uniref:Uncharacterized protein n=1 Tax=Aliiglaciecola litoralis TaxID=582857 RepID=A0ABN1LDL3_9ALTE